MILTYVTNKLDSEVGVQTWMIEGRLDVNR